jgi:hypothetical protein
MSNSQRHLPNSIEACREEVESLGLVLRRNESEGIGFVLVDERSSPARTVERFEGELWTELECAQAAVRFARYFLAPAVDHA